MNKEAIYLAMFSLALSGSMTAQSLPQLGKSSVDELIAAMTLEEKICLLVGASDEDSLTIGTSDTVRAVVGSTRKLVPGAV